MCIFPITLRFHNESLSFHRIVATRAWDIAAASCASTICDDFFLDDSSSLFVNFLPTYIGGELPTALGCAALLAKNFTLAEAPRRLLP